MKRTPKRLPIPQHEFGFVPDMFDLIQDTAHRRRTPLPRMLFALYVRNDNRSPRLVKLVGPTRAITVMLPDEH